MKAPLTKPGAHGTLYRYAVRYRDPIDDGRLPDVWRCWAYDAEHAEERFLEATEGYEVLGVERVLVVPS